MYALLSLVIFLGLLIAYLFTLNNTLKAVAPFNRKAEISHVWLMLIPAFNLIWQFVLYKKIADSIRAEYVARGINEDVEPSYVTGVAAAALLTITMVGNQFSHSLIFSLLSFASMCTWIAYWVQINTHKKRIQSLPPEELSDSEIFGPVNRL